MNDRPLTPSEANAMFAAVDDARANREWAEHENPAEELNLRLLRALDVFMDVDRVRGVTVDIVPGQWPTVTVTYALDGDRFTPARRMLKRYELRERE